MLLHHPARGGNHSGDHHLATGGQRNTDYRRIRDHVVLFEGDLNLRRGDVETAGNNNFLNTVDNLNEVVLIQAHNIAGTQPTLGSDGLRRLVLTLPVASKTLRALHPQLALFALGHVLTGLRVHHTNIGGGERNTNKTGTASVIERVAGDQRGTLGQAVAFHHETAGRFLPLGNQLRRQVHRTRNRVTDTLQGHAALLRLIHQAAIHRRNRRKNGRAGLLHRLQNQVHVHGREQHQAGTAQRRNRYAQGHTVRVEQRQNRVNHLVIARVDPCLTHAAVRLQVAVREHHALRQTGRTRGVLQQRNIVRRRAAMRRVNTLALHQLSPRHRTRRRTGQLLTRSTRALQRQLQRGTHQRGHRRNHVHRINMVRADIRRKTRNMRGDLIPHNRDLRAVILKHVAQLRARVQRVMLHHNRAQAQNRVKRRNMLRAVRQDQRHTVTRLHTSHTQTLRSTLNLIPQLGVGRGRAEELQRHLVGYGADRLVIEVAQRGFGQLNIAGSPRRIILQPGAMRQRMRTSRYASGGCRCRRILQVRVLLSLSHALIVPSHTLTLQLSTVSFHAENHTVHPPQIPQ